MTYNTEESVAQVSLGRGEGEGETKHRQHYREIREKTITKLCIKNNIQYLH